MFAKGACDAKEDVLTFYIEERDGESDMRGLMPSCVIYIIHCESKK